MILWKHLKKINLIKKKIPKKEIGLDDIGYYDLESGEDIPKEEYEQAIRHKNNQKIKAYKEKLKDGTITQDEFNWLNKIIDLNIPKTIKYENFAKINLKEIKDKLSKSDLGTFMLLSANLSYYHNEVLAANNKPFLMNSLTTYLGFKQPRYCKDCLDRIKKAGLIHYELDKKSIIIIVNPVYIQRVFHISNYVYNLFKEDLDKYLSYEQKLLIKIK